MRFRFIWVGKTRNEHLRALAEDYLGRLGRFVRCEVTEVREAQGGDPRSCVEEEGKRVAALLSSDALTVLLDVGGRQWDSEGLAAEVGRWQVGGVREAAFVVGGHHGVSEGLRRLARARWSLSPLTLTHEWARVLLVEQLYRAHTILRGLPYQK